MFMKILVAIKRVIDYKVAVRVKADGSDVETTNVKMSMNPFDEIAVEEAIRIKERGEAEEVIAVSIGEDPCKEILRTALAFGCDRAIQIKTSHSIQPLTAAKLLKALVNQTKVTLVILGKQAIDTDHNQVGQMLAGLLGWAQGTFASKLEFQKGNVSVTREIDGGLEKLLLTMPAVITTDLRLNEPRYLSLPNIVKAKKKLIDVIPAEELASDLEPHVTILNVSMPEKKRAGQRLENVSELVHRLQELQVI